MEYTELQVTSNFSFLTGASHPEEIMTQAAALGHQAIALTDCNTLAGIVRAHVTAKKLNIKLIVGATIQTVDGVKYLLFPINKNGYATLCKLLSTGNLRAPKGECFIYKSDIYDIIQDCIIIITPPLQLDDSYSFSATFIDDCIAFKKIFDKNVYLSITRRYNGNDQKHIYRTQEIAYSCNIPLVATNDVYYHNIERRQLQDILTCIKEKCTIHNAGYKLYSNAERHLKDAAEMHRLFRNYPEAIENTQKISKQCTFTLDEIKYEYPEEITSNNRNPMQELEQLALLGAHNYYGPVLPQKIIDNINYELKFIKEMNYAAYFLTVYDIVKFARSRGILCQGRGSAANSTICFCLGITSVNPAKFDLLFERFISAARNEPPDIDVDFEHERREEVIQYIYEKYGRDRAAIVATVTQLHQKGVIRDVAKAMGLSLDAVNKLSSTVHRMSGKWFTPEMIAEAGLDINDVHLKKTFELAKQYLGFPRQLGQHTGGFLITKQKMWELCPILNARMENRTCIEWNKDDIEALGFLKIDVLALGMLTCIRKAFDLIYQHYKKNYSLATIPQDDAAVYDMICKADTIGVFQIESRAQQQMLPRLKPRTFYDLVIQVAIVRPGPIQGDMVHPYLKRRNGEEQVSYPSPELEAILKRTLGIPLFQEQAMKIAIVAAGFTPAEADELRRSMATFKMKGDVHKMEEKLIKGMLTNGYSLDYAKRVFRQLEGFGSYGFPESHAASFALLVYVSCWIKCHYPDVFAGALLNSLPMGFYQPAQIIQDAINHNVMVLPVDINYSNWDNTLIKNQDQYCVLQLGFRNISGLRKDVIDQLVNERKTGFTTMFEIMNTQISIAVLEKLAEADAFNSLGLDRRNALWHLSAKDQPVALFANEQLFANAIDNVELPKMTLSEHVLHDYATTSISLKAHPIQFFRQELENDFVSQNKAIKTFVNGSKIKVAGLVLIKQRPPTAKGVWFITIEDETAIANIIIFPQVAEQYKKQIIQARLLAVEGIVQVQGLVVNLIATSCYDYSHFLQKLTK